VDHPEGVPPPRGAAVRHRGGGTEQRVGPQVVVVL
jgi:hypothetical protein